jgi:hypothetical protein
MECNRVKELLPFIDDGSLEQDIVIKVKAHMQKCPDCQKEYNDIKHILTLMNSVLIQHVQEHPQNFLNSVQRKIDAKKKAQKVYQWMLPAAAVIILTVSVMLYSISTRQITDTIPLQVASSSEFNNELYNYIAEQHFGAYELFELVYEVETIDRYDLRDAVFQHEYFDVTPEDIYETLDTDELYNFFISSYN